MNYGVGWPICFDSLFGTYVSHATFLEAGGSLADAKALEAAKRKGGGVGAAGKAAAAVGVGKEGSKKAK